MQNSIMHNQIPTAANMQPQAQIPPQQVYSAPVTPPVSTANPNYAGVNIQIFNPMVGSPNGYVYPNQTASAYGPGVNGGCYPSNYYTTGQYPQGTFVPQNPYGQPGGQNPPVQNGYYDQNGAYYPSEIPGQPSANTGAESKPVNPNDTASSASQAEQQTPASPVPDNKNPENTAGATDGANTKDAAASEAAGGENNPSKTDEKDGKKTEKRQVVELTDDYIKTLENYLNSQDTEVRLMGAKEVVNRLTEDPSRKDDPALTALVNKMLQDPSSTIRAIALSLIDSRTVSGDDYTVNVLKKMQTSKEGFGQDSLQATSALLKMAGQTAEKEVEVKDPPKKDDKQEKTQDKK